MLRQHKSIHTTQKEGEEGFKENRQYEPVQLPLKSYFNSFLVAVIHNANVIRVQRAKASSHEENSACQPKGWRMFLIFECKVTKK
jgi:hypothetical protein